jgi:hypothetical protein
MQRITTEKEFFRAILSQIHNEKEKTPFEKRFCEYFENKYKVLVFMPKSED